MATFDEVKAGAYAGAPGTGAGGILAGYKGLMTAPQPTGADLTPGFVQRQQDALALQQAGIGSYQPFLTAGAQAAQQSMASTGPGAAQQYLNPYLQQQANTTMTDLNRLFDQQQASQTQRQIQSGSFAGSGTRGAVMDAELARGQGDVSAKALSNIYSGGYNMAQKAALDAAKTQGALSQQYGNLGQIAQGGLRQDVGDLFRMGEAERQIIGQQNLNEYQTPFYGLGQFASAVSGMPSFSQYQATNPILTGLAAAQGVGSLFNNQNQV